jgi:hypothetical protein
MITSLPGPVLLSACLLLLAGCLPTDTRPADPVQAEPPLTQPVAERLPVPGWVPLHADPRPGDYVIHQRLTPTGLAAEQRRTEVLRVHADGIELRRSIPDRPAMHLQIDVDGVVQRAWHAASPGSDLQPGASQRRETRLKRAEDLALVSGTFPITRIVTQQLASSDSQALTAVYYLSPRVPFREVVSLTTAAPLSARQLRKLLGRIAVLTPRAGQQQGAGYRAPIEAGWIVVQWARGDR